MNAVGLDGQRDIEIVIYDERHAGRAALVDRQSRFVKCMSYGGVLLTKLYRGGAAPNSHLCQDPVGPSLLEVIISEHM